MDCLRQRIIIVNIDNQVIRVGARPLAFGRALGIGPRPLAQHTTRGGLSPRRAGRKAWGPPNDQGPGSGPDPDDLFVTDDHGP